MAYTKFTELCTYTIHVQTEHVWGEKGEICIPKIFVSLSHLFPYDICIPVKFVYFSLLYLHCDICIPLTFASLWHLYPHDICIP